MIDLYKLYLFTVVAGEGSFTAASERLYMSQSAVSQHMKDLEAGLGSTLFHRGRRGVRLTDDGDVLYDYARRILDLVAEAEVALTDVGRLDSGRLQLGATPGIATYLAPDWVERFRGLYPRLNVAVQTGITSQIVADVLAGRLDLAYIEGELDAHRQPRLASQELEEIEQLVVIGPSHAWWGRDRVNLSELYGQPFVMRPPSSQTRIWLDAALAADRVVPVVASEFDNVESIKRTVAQGPYVTILPEYAVRGDVGAGTLQALSINGRPLRRTLKMLWAADGHLSPVAKAFVDLTASEFPSPPVAEPPQAAG